MRTDRRAKIHIAGEKLPGKPHWCIRCKAIISLAKWDTAWEVGAPIAAQLSQLGSPLRLDAQVHEPGKRPDLRTRASSASGS